MRLGPERCFDVIDAPESDRFEPEPAVAPTPTPAPVARKRSTALWVVVTLLALAILALVYFGRQGLQMAIAIPQTQMVGMQSSLATHRNDITALRTSVQTLETRLADATATNRVLREELLAMGERASLLQAAVARLADNRMRGEVMLRLNEAEFLLLLGEERLRLFGDVPAAIQAYTLTDAALAGLDDPSLATLRQTLAQELIALREVPADPRAGVRAELAQIAAKLPLLPESRAGVVATADANDSRLVQLLSSLVTVRRVSERDAVLGPVQRETALSALRLQLELAQAALARPDVAAFRHAIDAALAQAAQLFDTRDEEVARMAERLRALRETALVPELPVLGATLQELRGLRATRSVGGLERPLTVPSEAAPAAEPQAAPDGAGA